VAVTAVFFCLRMYGERVGELANFGSRGRMAIEPACVCGLFLFLSSFCQGKHQLGSLVPQQRNAILDFNREPALWEFNH